MNATKFTLRTEHIKLLQHAGWYWDDCANGAPVVDPKRPYGSSYDVAGDVAAILDIELKLNEEGDGDPDHIDELLDLHRGTLTALQIILQTKSFEPGDYEFFRHMWRRVR